MSTLPYGLTGDGEMAQAVTSRIMLVYRNNPQIGPHDILMRELREELKAARYADWFSERRELRRSDNPHHGHADEYGT